MAKLSSCFRKLSRGECLFTLDSLWYEAILLKSTGLPRPFDIPANTAVFLPLSVILSSLWYFLIVFLLSEMQ